MYGWHSKQRCQNLPSVFFYIPCTRTNRSNSSGQIYVKERHRLQTVHWQSIIEIQPGK